jgi:hypothetical protein
MPIGPYPDFAACVTAQRKRGKSDIAARKICGTIEQNVKHHKEMSTEQFEESLAMFEELYPDDEQLSTESALLRAVK